MPYVKVSTYKKSLAMLRGIQEFNCPTQSQTTMPFVLCLTLSAGRQDDLGTQKTNLQGAPCTKHTEICKLYQSTSKLHDKLLQHLTVQRAMSFVVLQAYRVGPAA